MGQLLGRLRTVLDKEPVKDALGAILRGNGSPLTIEGQGVCPPRRPRAAFRREDQ